MRAQNPPSVELSTLRRPITHDQRLKKLRGGRARDDAAYDRGRRAKCPALSSAARIRGSARWKAVRAEKRRRDPLCQMHEARGATVEASSVDHIKPLATHPELAFVMSNLMSLCEPCHAKKSAQERMAR